MGVPFSWWFEYFNLEVRIVVKAWIQLAHSLRISKNLIKVVWYSWHLHGLLTKSSSQFIEMLNGGISSEISNCNSSCVVRSNQKIWIQRVIESNCQLAYNMVDVGPVEAFKLSLHQLLWISEIKWCLIGVPVVDNHCYLVEKQITSNANIVENHTT